MVGRPTWTDCEEAGDYIVPYVLSPWDVVSRPDNMDETVTHSRKVTLNKTCGGPRGRVGKVAVFQRS